MLYLRTKRDNKNQCDISSQCSNKNVIIVVTNYTIIVRQYLYHSRNFHNLPRNQ